MSTLTRARSRVAERTPPPQMKSKTHWGTHIALISVCILVAIPAFYAILVATMTRDQAFQYPPRLTPGTDFFNNLGTLLDQGFGRMFFNTTVAALIVVVGKTVTSMLAGLAFVYFRFPFKWFIFFFVLLTLLMPTEIIIVPLFRLMAELQWGDTRYALTVPFLASATGAFLFRQHFSNIPRELAEAAQIDGASPVRFMFTVLVPMSWNVIGALAVIQFVYMWNQYLWPVIIIKDPNEQLIQVGVVNAFAVGAQTDYGIVMAAAVIASVPPLFVFILLQRQFMSGFALTRDK
jgi:sn-glycerol 3-phosphate transport system permease protein